MGHLRKSSETIATTAGLLFLFPVVVVVVGAVSSGDVATGCYGNDTGYPVCFSAYRDRGLALRPWSNASAMCRGTFGGILPVISSAQIQLRLAEFLYDNQFTIDSVWLGAQGTTSRSPNADWRWVSGGGGGGGGGTLPSSDVLLSDSSFDLSMAVIAVDASGNASIAAESTSNTADGYICQYKQQTTCVGDSASSSFFGDGVNCFRRYDQPGNWFTSRNKCRYGNGDLATLDNTTTAGLNEVLRKLNSKTEGTNKKYWVGLTKLWWQWVPDSVEYNLTFFVDRPSVENPGVANGNCLAVDYRNQFAWTIRDCSIPFQTVCQTSALPTTTEESSSSSSSSVTLPVWAVGVIGGCVGFFYIVSLVIVAVIVCKCCRGHRKTTKERTKEETQQNGYAREPGRQVTNCSSIYPPQMPPPSDNHPLPHHQPFPEDEYDEFDEEEYYDNEIPPPSGGQYMNHKQAKEALGHRRPR